MTVAPQHLNGLHDLTMPYSGWIVICALGLATINLTTKFKVSMSTHYEDMKGDTKLEKGLA